MLRGRRQLDKCVWDCFAKYYGVDQSKKGEPGRAYRKHKIRIAYKILVDIPEGKKSVAYRWTDNIKICTSEVTCVGVVWIYLTHAAQLQVVLKMTTNGGRVLQNQLLAFQGGCGGGWEGGWGCNAGSGSNKWLRRFVQWTTGANSRVFRSHTLART